jgi:hypothetical protein
MTTEKNRPAFTAGLRAIADFLEEHPEVPLPYLGRGAAGSDLPALPIYLVNEDQKADLAAIARAMGNAVKAPKRHYDGSESFQVWREFDGIALYAQADRDAVCRRVVTGVEDREIEEVVTPAVTRKVTKPVEVVEWDCLPADAEGVADAMVAALGEPAAVETARALIGAEDEARPPECGAVCEHDGTCSLPEGHAGDHEAHGRAGRALCSWPQDAAPDAAQPEDIPDATGCPECGAVGLTRREDGTCWNRVRCAERQAAKAGAK